MVKWTWSEYDLEGEDILNQRLLKEAVMIKSGQDMWPLVSPLSPNAQKFANCDFCKKLQI